SIFTVCISLYVMDYIEKLEFARTESRRMLYNGVAWLLGPLVGVWLWEHEYPFSAFIVSMLAAVSMLAYFWHLRLGDNPVLVAAKPRKAIHPLVLIPHFFKQKFLRISYLITLSRAIFWVMLYVYGPIYVVEAGLPKWVGAALLSIGCAMLFFSPWVRALAERFHTKNILIFGMCLCGGSLLMLGLLGESQKIGVLFWWTGAWGASMIDVLGNIPFMRTVKPYERTEMTMVFSTWREMSELLTPLIISLVLLLLPFSTVYYIFGGFLLIVAIYARELPNRV
ncbi:MAG TPA: MFS transporter, partial [Thiolinea sp.]|nr:MFS transporter [Thiolinea sp.]